MIAFPAAAVAVQRHLDGLYAGEPEHPHVQAYGFDTGDAWAPGRRVQP